MAWPDVAWVGMTWRGVAWRGVAWRGVAWRGVTLFCRLLEEFWPSFILAVFSSSVGFGESLGRLLE